MGMFDNYHNINPSEHPDNMHFKVPVKKIVTSYDALEKSFDVHGNFIGYKWNYGSSISSVFTVNRWVRVAEDAIIYDQHGEMPTAITEGHIGQRAYNIVDMRSWSCEEMEVDTNLPGGIKYVWYMDDDITTFSDGVVPVQLTPDMTNKSIVVEFRDWKNELVYQKAEENSPIIAINIDKTESEKFVTGTYTCIVSIVSATEKLVTEKISIMVV